MNVKKPQDITDQPFAFSGNPVFHGPVLFNSIWNSGEAKPKDNANEEKTLEHKLDASVEEAEEFEYTKHKHSLEVYKIVTNPKGRVLILNNGFNGIKGKERQGSRQDFIKMIMLWESMGFAVELVTDQNASSMLNHVTEFVESKRVEQSNICAIMVMSHGKRGDFIEGKEGTFTNVQNIVNSVVSAEGLINKPKLLFFQMCRGLKAEKAVGLKGTESDAASSNDDSTDSEWFQSMLTKLIDRKKSDLRQNPSRLTAYQTNSVHAARTALRSVESDATAFQYVQDKHDMLIAFASQPDHVSFRGGDGSWFISAIESVFSKHAKDTDVKELMNMVKDEVLKRRSYIPSMEKYNGCTAAVEFEDTFKRKLYLYPGFPK